MNKIRFDNLTSTLQNHTEIISFFTQENNLNLLSGLYKENGFLKFISKV